MSHPLTPSQQDARVRLILGFPFTMSNAAVAVQVGLDREIVRRVRFGLKYPDAAPDVPRMRPEDSAARCWDCVHWEARAQRPEWLDVEPGDRHGRCLLGIPECKSEGMLWARGCGAFVRPG